MPHIDAHLNAISKEVLVNAVTCSHAALEDDVRSFTEGIRSRHVTASQRQKIAKAAHSLVQANMRPGRTVQRVFSEIIDQLAGLINAQSSGRIRIHGALLVLDAMGCTTLPTHQLKEAVQPLVDLMARLSEVILKEIRGNRSPGSLAAIRLVNEPEFAFSKMAWLTRKLVQYFEKHEGVSRKDIFADPAFGSGMLFLATGSVAGRTREPDETIVMNVPGTIYGIDIFVWCRESADLIRLRKQGHIETEDLENLFKGRRLVRGIKSQIQRLREQAGLPPHASDH